MININRQVIFDNFVYDHNRLYSQINKTNSQISSGKKINHPYDDSVIFTQSLRLSDEVKDLDNIKKRTSEAKTIADSIDSILSNFDSDIRDFKNKLLAAANSPLNTNNYKAIATELEGIKKHMMNLANSQVNGIYLFSGTNTNIQPIDKSGNYHGNSTELTTIISNNVTTPYSIDGHTLFLGTTDKNKIISTNVQLKNYDKNRLIEQNDEIKDMIKNPTSDNINFFISGKKHDGTAFKKIISLKPNTTVNDLLDSIETAFGNTKDIKYVDATLNDDGSISIKDLTNKKSNLSMNIVGFQGGNSDSETDLTKITYDNIIKFTKSEFETPLRDSNNQPIDESLNTDAYYFKKDGAKLISNVSLIYNEEFATNSTKLEELAKGNMNGKIFKVDLVNINGASKQVEIKLSNNNPPSATYSTFTIKGSPDTTYNIYNADGTQTNATDMTLGQLNNIISMVVSDTLPATTDNSSDFENAIISARKKVEVKLNSEGKLTIKDKTTKLSKIKFAIYDKDANDFSSTTLPATISFMSNNLITTAKPEIDFFKDLDNIIESVKNGKINITDNSNDRNDPRNISIQNSIEHIDRISAHFNTQQSKIGIYSKRLELENEKATILQTNVKTLKSEIEDIDLAETITRLNNLTLNYQAMLSTITKVNSLSLLSYMK